MKTGDKVKIVNYGHLLTVSKNDKTLYNVFKKDFIYSEGDDYIQVDTRKDLVGKIAIIDQVSTTQGITKYALKGVNKTAWYEEKQLELV